MRKIVKICPFKQQCMKNRPPPRAPTWASIMKNKGLGGGAGRFHRSDIAQQGHHSFAIVKNVLCGPIFALKGSHGIVEPQPCGIEPCA